MQTEICTKKVTRVSKKLNEAADEERTVYIGMGAAVRDEDKKRFPVKGVVISHTCVQLHIIAIIIIILVIVIIIITKDIMITKSSPSHS